MYSLDWILQQKLICVLFFITEKKIYVPNFTFISKILVHNIQIDNFFYKKTRGRYIQYILIFFFQHTQTKYVGRRQFLNYVFISVGVCPLLLRHTLLSLNVIMLGWEPDVEWTEWKVLTTSYLVKKQIWEYDELD